MADRGREEVPMVSMENGPELQKVAVGRPMGGPHEEGAKKMQYIAGFLATLGALAAGTVLAWTGPVLPVLKADGAFMTVTEFEGSWIASLMPIGAGLGALPAGPITDRLGRKVTMLVLAVPFVISWLLIIFASNVPMLYAARFIGGLATGATSVAAPMYCAEIAETSVRGSLGTFFQLQVTIGILLTFIVGGLSTYTVLGWVSLVVPVLWFGAVLTLPETPVLLLKKRKPSDAEKSLQRLRGPEYRGVRRELGDMQRALDEAARNEASIRELFSSRAVVKALIICLGLMVFQQVSGINAIMFFMTTIFKSASPDLDANVATIIVGVVQVLATGAAAVLVERAGRRVLLLGSATVMTLTHGVLGGYFYMKDAEWDVSAVGWLPVLCVVLFVVVFSLAFGPIPWMMAGELFTDEVKGPASTIAAAVNWTMAFAVTNVFSILIDKAGPAGTFWIFGGCCLAATVFVAVLCFETKGMSQEAVQRKLSGRA